MPTKRRCPWGDDPLLLAYHDLEWGKPVHDDRLLFEHLTLDCMQAGLSWLTILRKREAFRRAFDGFDPSKVARYDERRIQVLLADRGIVRNRMKIEATVNNAERLLEVQREHGSFDSYIWSFVGGKTIQNRFSSFKEMPAKTPESERMSKALQAKGFRFVGPTICYSFMQAVGMVNDHLVDCYRHGQLVNGAKAHPTGQRARMR